METNFNFNSQIATNRSQSERLLALGLKKETADMMHCLKETTYIKDWFILPLYHGDKRYTVEKVPAWSLHRLLCMLPRCVEGGYHLAISYDHIEYRTTYSEVTTWWRGGGNTYDMIIETIEWLIKEGYFNKEYLEE